ncbi:SH3-domain GRB2-like B1 (endophilin) [Cricetulus griseus]
MLRGDRRPQGHLPRAAAGAPRHRRPPGVAAPAGLYGDAPPPPPARGRCARENPTLRPRPPRSGRALRLWLRGFAASRWRLLLGDAPGPASARLRLRVRLRFTEEKLGQAEKTELDAHLENLLSKAECTKIWTEKIMKQTEVLLQPNPNARIEEFVYEKLDRKAPSRINNPELLGQYMIDAGTEFGPGTAYGNALIKCGEAQKRIGTADRELIQTSALNFLTPLRNFIEGDYKTITKERKLLQNKRLDLDAAKTRVKKAKAAEAKSSSEQELRITQSEFDRQAEITRLLLEGISSTHAHHLRCLNDFVEAQMTYYAQCYQYMLDLQKQLGSFPSNYLSNNNQTSGTPVASAFSNAIGPSAMASTGSLVINSPSNLNDLKESSGSRKARVLYDYDAANSTELSLLADEVITVFSVVGMDSDWLMGERGNQKGKRMNFCQIPAFSSNCLVTAEYRQHRQLSAME